MIIVSVGNGVNINQLKGHCVPIHCFEDHPVNGTYWPALLFDY